MESVGLRASYIQSAIATETSETAPARNPSLVSSRAAHASRSQVTGESLPADGKLADVDASSAGATSVTVALAFILLVDRATIYVKINLSLSNLPVLCRKPDIGTDFGDAHLGVRGHLVGLSVARSVER